MMVIGCKADEEAKRQVTLEEAQVSRNNNIITAYFITTRVLLSSTFYYLQQFCSANNLLVMETSAKADSNIKEVVSEMTAQLIAKQTGYED